jgi:hypothetical protein
MKKFTILIIILSLLHPTFTSNVPPSTMLIDNILEGADSSLVMVLASSVTDPRLFDEAIEVAKKKATSEWKEYEWMLRHDYGRWEKTHSWREDRARTFSKLVTSLETIRKEKFSQKKDHE